MQRQNNFNKRLEKVVKYYQDLHAYQKSGYKGIKKADSSKSLIWITTEKLVKWDKNGRELNRIQSNDLLHSG